MKTKTLFTLPLIIGLLLLLTSCSKPGHSVDFGLSPESVTFDNNGGDATVTSDIDVDLWSISYWENGEWESADYEELIEDETNRKYLKCDWAEVHCYSNDDGSSYITISVTENETGEDRRLSIKLTYGDHQDWIYVTQTK